MPKRSRKGVVQQGLNPCAAKKLSTADSIGIVLVEVGVEVEGGSG